MELHNDIGKKEIKGVIEQHPKIGEILKKYEIACTKCSIGTCLVKEVVRVHLLGDEIETQIEKEINEYLDLQAIG